MNAQQTLAHLDQVADIATLLEKDSYSSIVCPELKFKFMGEKLSNEFGLKNHSVIDKNLIDIETPLKHLSKHYRQISESIMSDPKNITREYITIIPIQKEMSVFHTKVNPILIENKKIGLYAKTQKVNATRIFQLLKKLNSITNDKAKIIPINDISKNIKLTDREEFILFMIALGKYDKEIAYLLQLVSGVGLTRDAITKIVVRNLYQKFDVVTRSELIMKAHNEGFLDSLPNLLNTENLLKIANFI